MLQNQEFSKDEARRLVIACFRELETNLEHGFVPETDDPEYELAEQVAAWSEVNCTVRSQLQNKAFDQPVIGMAKSLVGRNGHSWKELPAANRQDMLVGVSQALLEAHRLFLFRLESQLQPYHPANELFAESRDAPIAEAFPPAASKVGMPVGPSVKVVVEHFLQSMKSGWTPKTYRSRQTRLNYLIEFLGPDRILSTVNAADLREYSEGLLKFRNRNTCHVGKTFSEKQTNNPEHRISPYTANLIFITTKVFFAWAKSKKGYIEHNPASDLTIDVPKKAKKALKVRRPFSPEELKVLFSAPLFTGCLAVHRRFQPGKHIIKDDKYWIPLVGFFTGMRLGEIVQLHVDDVILDGAIPYIAVTDMDSGELGSDTHKSIKSDAGVRKVPLHPDLMDLGFANFIAHRRKEKHAPNKRVFWKTAFGKDGQASTVFSKWFGRLLDKTGLTDPALVFHSFRHSAEDAFRNAMLLTQPPEIRPVICRVLDEEDDECARADFRKSRS